MNNHSRDPRRRSPSVPMNVPILGQPREGARGGPGAGSGDANGKADTGNDSNFDGVCNVLRQLEPSSRAEWTLQQIAGVFLQLRRSLSRPVSQSRGLGYFSEAFSLVDDLLRGYAWARNELQDWPAAVLPDDGTDDDDDGEDGNDDDDDGEDDEPVGDDPREYILGESDPRLHPLVGEPGRDRDRDRDR